MTSAVKARNSNGGGSRRPPTVAAVPPQTGTGGLRRRRPAQIGLGVLLVIICGLVGAFSLAAVDHRTPVLVVTRTIQPGETITAADLGVAHVAGSGLATISGAASASVIGKVASGRIPAGSPIVPGELNSASPVDQNSVELPMALKAGAFPPDLAVGDQVLLVPTVGAGSAPPTPSAAGGANAASTPVSGRVRAVVVQKAFGSTSGTTVTVTVARSDLAVLANAAAAGQIVVARAAP